MNLSDLAPSLEPRANTTSSRDRALAVGSFNIILDQTPGHRSKLHLLLPPSRSKIEIDQ